MKNKFRFTILFAILILLSFSPFCNAAYYPDLVSKLFNAFEKIETWFLKLSTPAAAVAICTGVFMRKFSFGDEERIRTGKKIIRGSIFSYAFILLTNLILSAVQALLK